MELISKPQTVTLLRPAAPNHRRRPSPALFSSPLPSDPRASDSRVSHWPPKRLPAARRSPSPHHTCSGNPRHGVNHSEWSAVCPGGSCTDGSVAEAIQAANVVPQPTVVNISASSGASGQVPLIQPLTVTSGCVPVACSGGPSCGPQPNGCGGTMTCGCADPNQICGGGGVANQCGTPVVSVSSLTLNPSSVVGGGASTGTVSLNPPAGFGGTSVALASNSSFVTVPASVFFPSGANVATFTAATTRLQAGTVVATVSATLHTTASADLTVTAAPACVPTTCAALGKICGTAPDGCGGTLTCGSTCGSSSAAITLSVGGKGGKVTSSPAGLNVSSGRSASASFTIGSTLTLTTDNGHGYAIWSGLCSSNGRATQSCAFTVTAAGSVTANEQ